MSARVSLHVRERRAVAARAALYQKRRSGYWPYTLRSAGSNNLPIPDILDSLRSRENEAWSVARLAYDYCPWPACVGQYAGLTVLGGTRTAKYPGIASTTTAMTLTSAKLEIAASPSTSKTTGKPVTTARKWLPSSWA
jgi:hypothetical protein